MLVIPASDWHEWLYDKIKDSTEDSGIREMIYVGDFERELQIKFETTEQEIYFALKYL